METLMNKDFGKMKKDRYFIPRVIMNALGFAVILAVIGSLVFLIGDFIENASRIVGG